MVTLFFKNSIVGNSIPVGVFCPEDVGINFTTNPPGKLNKAPCMPFDAVKV